MSSSLQVSIIMATYNRAHFIIETLQSVKKQTYTNWECLIIDDGSTDNTEKRIKPILEKDSRFKYLKRPKDHKKGLPGCRNYGLKNTKGDYVIFFDDDDIVHPLNLEICLSALNKNENLSFCNYKKEAFLKEFDYSLINKYSDFNIKETDSSLLHNVITQKIPFASCTVIWKKACFNENYFNEELMYAEEWECYQRLLSTKIKGVIIDKVLYYNRKHDESNTGEFWSHSPIRVNSKKKAIELVVFNLKKKGLLTSKLFKYLVNLAISFRDYKLVKNILEISKTKKKESLYYVFKFYAFPIWVYYKKILKN